MDFRRSGNYKPSIWEDKYVQSRPNLYAVNPKNLEEKYCKRAEKLKEEVRKTLEKTMTNSLEQLELIDILQRLGIYHHFEEEIDGVFEQIYVNNTKRDHHNEELYATALEFRLLRQQGYHAPQGFTPNPRFGYCRKLSTKLAVLITTIDDIYDVYGTLDELELFTHIVDRWDINAIEQLPEYMKICFLALFNSMNELAYDILKEQGVSIISHIRKQDEIKKGDYLKSIQCYMYESKSCEENARSYINNLIDQTWKKMNCDILRDGSFSKDFRRTSMNLARIAQCMYVPA